MMPNDMRYSATASLFEPRTAFQPPPIRTIMSLLPLLMLPLFSVVVEMEAFLMAILLAGKDPILIPTLIATGLDVNEDT